MEYFHLVLLDKLLYSKSPRGCLALTSSSGLASSGDSPGGWLNEVLPPGSSGQASLLEDGETAEWIARGGLKAHDKFAAVKARIMEAIKEQAELDEAQTTLHENFLAFLQGMNNQMEGMSFGTQGLHQNADELGVELSK